MGFTPFSARSSGDIDAHHLCALPLFDRGTETRKKKGAMSTCCLGEWRDHYEVTIGWDPPTRTFFAQVMDNTIKGEDFEKIVLWLGGVKPGDRYLEPDELIEAIQPYACKHDPEILRRELMKDKATDDERHYFFDQNNVPSETSLADEPTIDRAGSRDR